MPSCLALLPHVLRSLKPKTAIWPHVCIVFEAKLWYCHRFFIVWKSNLWCFCIFCVVLEAKMRNYHMFWHFSSILHRVDHHFIMNMLFFLQFLHIFDPNLPTTPSVNWKFAVGSWLVGNHLHLKYGTNHADKKKTWLSSQCCTNQRQKAWLYPQESEHKKCAPRAKSNAPGRGCTRSKPKVCTKPRPASNMCSYREIRSHSF